MKKLRNEGNGMDENTAGYNLRELREKGLPLHVEKELKKLKALLPVLECLQPHELFALENNADLEITGKGLLKKICHVAKCKFCKGLLSRLLTKEEAETLLGKIK